MSDTKQILIAGFGGQGVLFTGKCLANAALTEGKQLSWLPSYGPEMRGGTANCSVIISDRLIGSPIVDKPDILIAMNLPSLDKYEDAVISGGFIFADSSLIERKVKRNDVKAFYVPATQTASDKSLSGLANMIMLGKMLKECPVINYDELPAVLQKVIPAKHKDLYEFNLKAIKTGYEFN